MIENHSVILIIVSLRLLLIGQIANFEQVWHVISLPEISIPCSTLIYKFMNGNTAFI